MTLKSLFDKRYSRYLKTLLKYSRHIINDHFVFILAILLGAAALAYSDFLETLTPGMIEPRLFLVGVYFITTATGSVTLLLEPADQIFLLPKENEFGKIFKKLTTFSYLMSLISLAVITLVTFPLLAVTINAQQHEGILLFFALAGLKWLTLLTKFEPFFDLPNQNGQKQRLINWLVNPLAICGLLFLSIQWTAIVIIAIALTVAFLFYKEQLFFNHVFKWPEMIEAEEARLQRLYRFISQFTDVPHIEPRIKRLAWLDQPLQWLSQRNPTTSYYYMIRLIARNPEYSMLILRLTLVGSILMAFTQSLMLSFLITGLFLYLIGFQLLSLAQELTRPPQFQMYPIVENEKTKAVLQIIFHVLILVSVIMALAAINAQGMIGLTLFPLGLFFSFIFSHVYASRRI